MSTTDILNGARAVVFDAYGTLLDIHSAVQRHAGAVGPDAKSLSDTWRQKQLEYTWVLSLCGRYTAFWTLTEQALDYAIARHPNVDLSLKPALLESYRRLDAYPEVPGTLDALREQGIKTAILSNGDTAMLDLAVRSAALHDHLDEVLSVDQAKIFKTSPRAYDLAVERLGFDSRATVFVSSNRWDVAGAAAYGFKPIWVNRTRQPNEYPDFAPMQIIESLDGLLR